MLSLQGAQDLIDSDPAGCIMDWSFLLAYHGYDVPAPGTLHLGGAVYTISESGAIA
jgi:hypothetical protein